MQGMLRDAKPSRLEDLIALNAHVPARADGPHPELLRAQERQARRSTTRTRCCEPVLAETYGIMVYQEQVMQAAQVLAGYSLGGADMLRRAMGKKKAEEMAKQREIFRDGRGQEGIGAEQGRRGLRPDGEVRRLRLQQDRTPRPTRCWRTTRPGSRCTARPSSSPPT